MVPLWCCEVAEGLRALLGDSSRLASETIDGALLLHGEKPKDGEDMAVVVVAAAAAAAAVAAAAAATEMRSR